MTTMDRSETQASPRKKGITRNTIILVALLMVASFLGGFLPTYAKVLSLEKELQTTRQQNISLQLRDLSSLLYLQAIQKDFGLAAETSTRFFDRVREVAGQTADTRDRALLEEMLLHRDRITSELALGSPEAVSALQALVVSTRAATARSTGALPAK